MRTACIASEKASGETALPNTLTAGAEGSFADFIMLEVPHNKNPGRIHNKYAYHYLFITFLASEYSQHWHAPLLLFH